MNVSEPSPPPTSEAAAEAREREEAALDLDEGFDDESLIGPAPAGLRKRGRSPFVAALVLVFGGYLLSSMWADFRHWLRSVDDAEDLGHARDLLQDGEFIRDFDNAYVEFAATVDLQHAAKLTTARGEARYLRLREGGARLFAQVPQEPDERADTVPDRFRGRMHRHGDTASFVWARKFFENEAITQTIDVTVDSVAAGRQNDDGQRVFDVVEEDRTVTLEPRDELRFVVPANTAVVQLGKTTWPSKADANATMDRLGVPYTLTDESNIHAFTYVAAIPETEREQARQQLQAGHDIPADHADPKIGATVLSRTATYSGSAETIEWIDGGWQVPLGFAHPGYEVVDGRLVARQPDGDRIRLAPEQVRAVRLERTLELDPDGYLLVVGEDPASQRMTAILFLVVCGIMAANAASLLLMLRRRS